MFMEHTKVCSILNFTRTLKMRCQHVHTDKNEKIEHPNFNFSW